MSETPRAVRAIVVHHDQPERCIDTIDALRAEGVPLRNVVVVDNGSSPEAIASLRALDVEVIEVGENVGFGAGANVGLRQWLADGGDDDSNGDDEWALVVPHDARPQPGCLARLVDAARARPRAGLASAEYGDDEVPVVDAFFGAMTVPATRGRGWEPAGYAHGTFLLLRRACLEDVGLFDERYFAYCEEADLAIRARRAGWDVGIVWDAVVGNPHQGSPPPLVDYLMARNTILLVRTHFGRYRAIVRLVLAAADAVHQRARPARRTPWYSWPARVRAIRDAARQNWGPPPPALR